MTDQDPADGLDPRDIEEIARLYQQINEQYQQQLSRDLTDGTGSTDSISIVVTPGSVTGEASLTGGGVLIAEGHAVAPAVPVIDPRAVQELASRTRKIAAQLGRTVEFFGAVAALLDAAGDVGQVLEFAKSVLHYLGR